MKLLLTSAGLTNQSITNELLRLAGKTAEEVTIGFIPTAANVEDDKSWLEEDLENIRKAGIRRIYMVDIAIMKKDQWLPLLQDSDVIWLNGGNTYYLLDQVRKSELQEELSELLETRIYVGSSAGSGIVGPDLAIVALFPEEEAYHLAETTGLGYVPFEVCPHLNSPYFKEPTIDDVKQFADTLPYPVYAIDDNTAVSISDGKTHIVTEGTYRVFDAQRPKDA